ncbi:Leucine- isoleucine- valine- threonine- and alanine-binding protein [Paramagnetospirillum magnetotacticum MS-1]|uniref:Leucine-isoleucine-valine-threonine-and alanine-binding protein n=1 Tax=Paramagnetospirillum magnetotacticum MS-1 TaxID=272627 RepID=A0A0C2UB99_PARME|nr:ABC transporter substrate-binding protein [Paramagnetospirillum magnetotacticum]KIL98772.1 Leucine- isoleucine- valine- threonine- and alanine-binding protein [Paramagnetospirillum magnetotacticum MS-1]
MVMKRLLLGAAALALSTGMAHAQYSDGKVKIGVLTDLSGTYSDLAGKGTIVAAQMAIDDFGGKINGQPIELISADHQNKADIASGIARKWYDTEQVDVIAELVTTAAAIAVREVSKEKGKIDLVSGAASTPLTNDKCSPTGFHWTYDTYALANGTGNAVVKNGGKTWFFLTADYAFGHNLQAQTEKVVKANGGEVKGAVKHPFPNSDFSSFLLQAQASGAQIIGLANAGADTINAIKQAKEFGITQAGQQLAGLLVFITDIHSLGLETAQGMMLTTGFYWDMDDQTRAWSKRWSEKMGNGKMPSMVHAGTYSQVLHYLRAAAAAKTDEGIKVADEMRKLPINDFFAKNGKIRADGRMVHDMYLAQVKKPSESKGPWDYYKIVRTIPGDEAYQPLSESTCSLVKK